MKIYLYRIFFVVFLVAVFIGWTEELTERGQEMKQFCKTQGYTKAQYWLMNGWYCKMETPYGYEHVPVDKVQEYEDQKAREKGLIPPGDFP